MKFENRPTCTLALIFALATGCLPLSNTDAAPAETKVPPMRDPIAERANFKGKNAHTRNAGFQVLAGRATPALIVIPDNPLPVHEYAAKELIEHVFKASGVSLPLVRERELKAGDAARARIYIGGTRALRNIGIKGMTGFGDIVPLAATSVSVSAPDTVREVKEVSRPMWSAGNLPDAKNERDAFIDVILDLGEKRRVAAISLKNRADTATNYNIGHVQLAVGAFDDGKNFERIVARGIPAPATNEADFQRIISLDKPIHARFVRVRIEANLKGVMGSDDSDNNAVWSGFGYAVAELETAANSKILDLETLPPNSFIVRTQGNALYLAGRDENGPPLQDGFNAGSLFAVYEWLERQLGVRWLWPGELGTQIPRAGAVQSGTWDVLAQPPLLHSRLRQTIGRRNWIPAAGGFTDEQRAKVISDEVVWYRRNRFARGVSLDYGHGYEDFWGRFNQSNPEFFNLLPDGTRRSDPFYHGGEGRLISMSVANRGFQQQVIEDWKARRSAGKPWINGWENDTSGKCLCADCLAWDVPDAALGANWGNRVELARRAFENKEPGWEKHLGSASDRYAKYYLALQEAGRASDPSVTVIGGAYANYARPPLQTKLNRNIVVGVVPEYGWPMNAATRAGFERQWLGWRKAGASMYLRPNYTLWGHEQPLFVARDYARDFKLAVQNGMIGTDYDSLTSMWATQGPNLYVLSRLHWRPDWTVEQILDEYYGAFGPAKKDVRQYFEYWETQTTRAAQQMAKMQTEQPGALLFGNWAGLHEVIGQLFTPGNYAAAAKFLDAAHKATGSDKTAQQRVEFLQAGLEDARLVAKTNLIHDEFKRTTKDEQLIAAIGELDRHREQMAQRFPNALNLDLAAWMENRDWNRAVYAAINAALENGVIISELPREWRLRWDENKAGQREEWFRNAGDDALWQPVRVDAPWEAQAVGKAWRDAHKGEDYNGLAWYRVRFKVDPKWRDQKLALLFGAVDEAATVYLNGQKIGEHPYVNPNDWQTPFQMDVSGVVDFEEENELMVLAEDNSGVGGVWKPVWLVQPR